MKMGSKKPIQYYHLHVNARELLCGVVLTTLFIPLTVLLLTTRFIHSTPTPPTPVFPLGVNPCFPCWGGWIRQSTSIVVAWLVACYVCVCVSSVTWLVDS